MADRARRFVAALARVRLVANGALLAFDTGQHGMASAAEESVVAVRFALEVTASARALLMAHRAFVGDGSDAGTCSLSVVFGPAQEVTGWSPLAADAGVACGAVVHHSTLLVTTRAVGHAQGRICCGEFAHHQRRVTIDALQFGLDMALVGEDQLVAQGTHMFGSKAGLIEERVDSQLLPALGVEFVVASSAGIGLRHARIVEREGIGVTIEAVELELPHVQ